MIIRRSGNMNAQPRNCTGEPGIKDTERALRDAGLSRKEAKTLLAVGYDAAAVMYGWEDDPRDADRMDQTQPEILRDAGATGPFDLEGLLARIRQQIS